MIDQTSLYRLTAWLSPGFPVGAYAYSHGLEHAVEVGLVGDRQSLTRWIEAILAHGAGRIDAMLFRAAWRAAEDDDHAALAETAARARAMRATPEMALESAAQGRAFLDTVRAAWPDPRLDCLEDAPYAVAVGAAAAVAGAPLEAALTVFLQAFAANLISAAVRLVPLGQTDGQMAQAALMEPVLAAARAAMAADPADIGGAAWVVDWTSVGHETQTTRLFRS